MNSFAMKTVVQYNQGDSSSFYGFFIKKMTESDTNDHFYHFAVSADKKFVISSSRDSLLEPVPIKNSTKVTALDYDTLELIRDNDVFTFIVNGTKLGECSEISGVINGAGLFVSSKLNVAFDKFQIMNIGLQTSNGKIIKRDSEYGLWKKVPKD